MAELSKTAKASMKTGQPVKADPFDTNEKKIKGLRDLRMAGLFVNRMDFVDALLEAYDKAQENIFDLRSEPHISLAADSGIVRNSVFIDAQDDPETAFSLSEQMQEQLEPLPDKK